MMSRRLGWVCSPLGAGIGLQAWGATGVTTNGTEVTVCVEEGATQSMPAIGAEITKVFKTGAGEAQFTPAGVTNGFTAALHIQAGTLAGYRASFGKASLITVTPGATLKLTGWDAVTSKDAEDTGSRVGAGNLEIGGAGVNGQGAFVRTFATRPRGTFGMFKSTKLTADTTANTGGGYIAFNRDGDGTFDMNGFTLSCIGGGRFDFTNGRVKNLGNIYLASTMVNFEGGSSHIFDANTNGAQVVFDGGSMMTWSARGRNAQNTANAPIPYGFHVVKDVYMSIMGGATSWENNWFSGPVTVDKGKTLTLSGQDDTTWRKTTFSGAITNEGTIVKNTGNAFRITTSRARVLGSFNVQKGTMWLENAGYAAASNVTVLGSVRTGANVARLVVTGETALASTYGLAVNKAHFLKVGNGGNQFGVVELFNGAITNNLRNEGGYGAVYQHSGIFRNLSWGGYDSLPILCDGYGAYVLEGGEMTFRSYMHYANRNASGFFVQHGGFLGSTENNGVYASDGILYFGGSDTLTHFYQDGGTNKIGYLGFNHDGQASKNIISAFTVTGAKTESNVRALRLNIGSNNAGPNRVCVNLNDGGRLTTGQITKGSGWDSASSGSTVPANTASSRIYLNFNGGVLRMRENTWQLFGGGSATLTGLEPERVTVYEKGAIVDTQNYTVNWTKPFLAPTGRRIKSITITDAAMLAENYAIGPCGVVISDATGEGASAITSFDPAKRQLGATVLVTSGGYNFSENPTVSVQTSTNRALAVAAAVTTEAAPTTGGLVKRGSGTLKLFGVNTYGGATRVEEGTLAFQDANGFPGGDIEIPAETAAALAVHAEPLVTFVGALTFADGKGVVVTEAEKLEDLGKTTFRKRRTVARWATARAAAPALRLVDSDGTPRTDPLWTLTLAEDGKALTFGPQFGTVLIVR